MPEKHNAAPAEYVGWAASIYARGAEISPNVHWSAANPSRFDDGCVRVAFPAAAIYLCPMLKSPYQPCIHPDSLYVGKPGKSNMNYGVPCDPIPAADVEGFRFYRDQNGDVVARCLLCSVGFAIREDNAEATADGYAS